MADAFRSDEGLDEGGLLELGAPREPGRHHLRALVSCAAVSDELPLVVDGTRRPSRAMSEHLESCLACQAELAGYRRLLRVLRSLKEEPVSFPAPAPELVGAALQAQLAARRRGAAGRWFVAGAMAAGAAALGAGVIVVVASRRTRIAPTGAH